MLTQTAIYALRTVGYIAARGGEKPVLARDIANEMKIPKNFLSKIANRLVQAGILSSVRGTKGGFRLSKEPTAISLSQVSALFMNISDFKRCLLTSETCDGSCQLHEKWKPISEQLDRFLNETTVDQILDH